MLNISTVTEEPKRLGFMLDKCFVCKSYVMEKSQDGVTCGRQSCRDGLPPLLEEINNAALKECIDDLEHDLNESEGTISFLKRELTGELTKKEQLTSSLKQLLSRTSFIQQVKDFEEKIKDIINELSD